jgi:hypothetical protein
MKKEKAAMKKKRDVVAFSVRVDRVVYNKLVKLAEASTRSLNGQIGAIIKEAVK